MLNNETCRVFRDVHVCKLAQVHCSTGIYYLVLVASKQCDHMNSAADSTFGVTAAAMGTGAHATAA